MGVSRTIELGDEDLLALRAATAPAADAALSWAELMAMLPFDEVNENTQRVIPAIFRNLRSAKDIPERERLRGAFKYVWSRNTELLHGLRPVLIELDERRVDYRLLKGAAVQLACDSLGSRAMGDVDLLVRERDAELVTDVLGRQGFRRGMYAACSGHADTDHHGALDFNLGPWRVDVHLAESKAPTRLLTMMMAAPAREIRAVGMVVRVPQPELLLLHAATHGCLASGPTDFVQAVVDVATLLPLCDSRRLVRAARLTGTLTALLELDAAVRAVGAEPLTVHVPWSDRRRAGLEDLVADVADTAARSSSVARRIRDRRRGHRAGIDVAHAFPGRRRAYRTWLEAGQFARVERMVVSAAGGFLARPVGTWVPGTAARAFAGPDVSGLTASPLGESTLDWRFRVRFDGPQRWARISLTSASLDALDTFVFRNGVPTTHVIAGDLASRSILLRDVPADNEFSLRPLWQVCSQCYGGLADLEVRIDLGDDAR